MCFDTFGEKMAIDDPFLVSISQYGDYEFKYKGSARFLKTIIVCIYFSFSSFFFFLLFYFSLFLLLLLNESND